MQVVIDIPEQDYVYIAKKHCFPSCDDRTLRKKFYEMVANGIPLPKGHGRLIDADKLVKQYNLDEATKYGNKNAKQQTHSYSTMMLYEIADMIDDAPSIIEADKAESEEQT